MTTILISLALLLLAGIAKAVQDTVQFNYYNSVFFPRNEHRRWEKWSNPNISWLNKYKENTPTLGPRFPFSTTILVWTTDLWHFAQTIELTAIQVAIALHVHVAHFVWADGPAWILVVLDVCMFKAVQSGSFELFFSRILKLNNNTSMSYKIWKWLEFANLPSRGAGIIVALIYLAIGAIITLATYWIAPGLPKWKYFDSVTAWEVVMVAWFVIWLIWFAWLMFVGAKKFEDRYKAEIGFVPGKKTEQDTDDGSTEWD